MNFTQFAGFYKESLIQMIYESCQQKYQLFNTIAQLSENIYKKCQKNSSDSQIEDLLSQLKVMVQYANQDISAHIDLALQQVFITKRIQLKIFPKKQGSDSSTGEATEKEDINEELHQRKEQPQISSVIQISSKNHSKNQKPEVDSQIQQQEEKGDELDTFKFLQKTLDSIESTHSINIPKNFRSQEFFISYQHKGQSLIKLLSEDDMRFVYDLQKVYETQRKIGLLLHMDPRVISKIIMQYKKDQGMEVTRFQRNYTKGKKKQKNKTTSINSFTQDIESYLEDEDELLNDQREKIFNPFVKETSKENSVIKKVRFQDEKYQKAPPSVPLNQSKLEKKKEEATKTKSQSDDDQSSFSEDNQKPVNPQREQQQIMVKLEESFHSDKEGTHMQQDKQDKNGKKHLIRNSQLNASSSSNQSDKLKQGQANKTQGQPKTNQLSKDTPLRPDASKNISAQTQKKLIQINGQKKQTVPLKK